MTDPTTRDPAASLRACIELAARATPDWNAKPHGVIVGGTFHEYERGTAQSQIAMFTTPRDDDDVTSPDKARDANAAAALACVNWTRDAAPALLAEVARLRTLVPQPPTLEEFHVVGNRVEARFAADFAQDMAASFLALCDEHGAHNFLELQMQAGDGQRLTVTVQKVNGETPGQQKAAAILRAEAAEQVAREAVALLMRVSEDGNGYLMPEIAAFVEKHDDGIHHGARTGESNEA